MSDTYQESRTIRIGRVKIELVDVPASSLRLASTAIHISVVEDGSNVGTIVDSDFARVLAASLVSLANELDSKRRARAELFVKC